jgi:TonB family protein
VRAARPIASFDGVMESQEIAVPVTVGWTRPKILLPAGWDAWDAERLNAVLVHERTHVRRGDWAIAAMAGVNRCVFWFHPLAWWLERELAVLAEHACDDASLAQVGSPESYAETLLAMAAALRGREGRLIREVTAMAKTSEVRQRVERILDDGRRILPGMTRARWCALAACGVPLIYLTAVVRPAHVLAQQVEVPHVMQAAAAQEVDPDALRRLDEMRRVLELQLRNNRTKIGLLDQQQLRSLARNEKLRELSRRIETLNSETAAMAEQLTENHPSLRRARESLAELERSYQAEEQPNEGFEKALSDLVMQKSLLEAEMERINVEVEETSRRMAKTPGRITVDYPRLISQRTPEYTDAARKARIQGTVELAITIESDGTVSDAKVVRSLDPGLDQKAVECVKLWRYTPLTESAERVKLVVNVEVPFRLM